MNKIKFSHDYPKLHGQKEAEKNLFEGTKIQQPVKVSIDNGE